MAGAFLDACRWLEEHREGLSVQLKQQISTSGRPYYTGRHTIARFLDAADRLRESSSHEDQREGERLLQRTSAFLYEVLDTTTGLKRPQK